MVLPLNRISTTGRRAASFNTGLFLLLRPKMYGYHLVAAREYDLPSRGEVGWHLVVDSVEVQDPGVSGFPGYPVLEAVLAPFPHGHHGLLAGEHGHVEEPGFQLIEECQRQHRNDCDADGS